MDDGVHKDLTPVYKAYRPEVTKYTIGGLETGLPYLFNV